MAAVAGFAIAAVLAVPSLAMIARPFILAAFAMAFPAQAMAACRLSTVECAQIETEEQTAKSVQRRAEARFMQSMRPVQAQLAAVDHAYDWRKSRMARLPQRVQSEWIRLLSCENGTPGVDCR